MRTGHVYCGNFTKWKGFFVEPDECSYEGDIDLTDITEEDDFTSWECPGCGATNTFRDHEVTDVRDEQETT